MDTKQNGWQQILHTVDSEYFPKSNALHAGGIHDKSVDSQARRIISAYNNYGIDAADLLWVISVDNSGSAYNVPGMIRMLCLRRGAYVIALGPKHLFYRVGRTEEGQETLAVHKRADAECISCVDQIRRIHKRVPTNGKAWLQFKQIQKSRG